MGIVQRHYLLLPVLQLAIILLLPFQVNSSADQKGNLLQGINSYRTTLNLSALTENNNADCLADEVASQYKDQPCSNNTGADTVPGTEPQLSNYPDLLAKCHLNITNTREGVIMPACVPNLVPTLVLTNYTETQYSGSLNDSTYTGAGIGSEGNWIVVVLSTNTVGGSFSPAQNSAGLFPNVVLMQNFVPLFLASILVLLS